MNEYKKLNIMFKIRSIDELRDFIYYNGFQEEYKTNELDILLIDLKEKLKKEIQA